VKAAEATRDFLLALTIMCSMLVPPKVPEWLPSATVLGV
jgi:hypothetical protein